MDAVVERSYVPIDGGDQGGSEPYVEYRYTVNGTEYTNSQLCPVAGATCTGDAEEVVEKYGEGETVTTSTEPIRGIRISSNRDHPTASCS